MTSRARYVATVLPVAFVATVSWFGVFTLVNAYVVKGLGGSDADWADVTKWLYGGMVPWMAVCIELSARIGRRSVVTLGLLGVAAAFVVIPMTRSIHVVGLMLGVMAFFQAAASVTFVPLLVEAAGARPGRAIALYQWFVTTCTVVSLTVGGYLVQRGSYHQVFLGIAGLCLLATAVFHLAAAKIEHGVEPVVSLRKLSRPDLAALISPPFLAVLLLGLCGEPAYYVMVNNLFPNFARNAHGMGEDQIGLIVALGRLPSLVTLFVVAHWIDRLNIRRLYACGIFGSALVASVFVWLPGRYLMIGMYLLYYALHGIVWGSNCAAINSTVTARVRNVAFLILAVMQSGTAFLVGVAQARMLVVGWSIPRVFTTCGLVSVACAVALWGLTFYRRFQPLAAFAPVEVELAKSATQGDRV